MKKIALITGANRGIGFAICKGLLEKGVEVILTARSEEKGQKAVTALSGLGPVHFQRLDVGNPQSRRACALWIRETFGRLDILVNNAGINYDTWQNVENADLEEVHQTFETNFFAPWALTQELLPLLKESEGGRIVNVSSGAGSLERQNGTTPGYSASKLALNGLTLQFSNHLKDSGILVNSVCPGWVRTDMGGHDADRSPEEGAETIIWAALLGDDGPTGQFFRDKKPIAW